MNGMLKRMLWVLPAAAGLLRPAAADSLHESIRQGNAFYDQGQFEQALGTYQEAVTPERISPELDFNIGNTFYQMKKFDEALDTYRKVYSKEKSALNREAQFNIGAALYRQAEAALAEQDAAGATEKLKQSLEQYKQLLRRGPVDEDLKYNYCQVRRKLRELEQQQESEQKQQQQSKNKK